MQREARAEVAHIRQETQYTCCAASIAAALRALGKEVTEADVNRVLGAAPMAGATWEAMLATVQYFGCRGRLVVPATLKMVKEWTDGGIPVVIAWNPEGRPWSHASVIFDVEEDLTVHVMDPNIPDPEVTERVVPRDDFYRKWFEKAGESLLIRRPAMAVEREVTTEGRQVVASDGEGRMGGRRRVTAGTQVPNLEDAWGLESKTAAKAPTGLYGYTKAIQGDCEAAARRLAKVAYRAAKAAYDKDPEVVDFLTAHLKRDRSVSARTLLSAMREIGPKIGRTASVDRVAGVEYGLYGFRAKTADLGLDACREVRGAAGRIAADLHRRRAEHHEKITGFLKAHSKQARCAYSGLLHSCYPDATMKLASVPEPMTVEGWLALDQD